MQLLSNGGKDGGGSLRSVLDLPDGEPGVNRLYSAHTSFVSQRPCAFP